MTKQIITYILFAACLLSACRSDYYDLEPVTDSSNEALSLTVSASDVVVYDGITSRADDKGGATVFQTDDRIGLTITDKDGRLLADNVPYKFNGTDWIFDDENTDGKQRVYYDATMSTYIVYFPYHSSVTGVIDESYLKGLPAFARRENQSEEIDYRFSDPMLWTYTGEALKHINVELKHIRNSISLDLKVKWALPLPKDPTLEYHPVKAALEDFKIRYEDGNAILNVNDSIDYTYHAEDTSYRYILPDGYSGKVTWRYTYRGESFGGESRVLPRVVGVRYVQDTSADISYKKVEIYDYYSTMLIDDVPYGFCLPWDAEECYQTYPPIGVVFQLGQHKEDLSDYSKSGINQKECNGYAVSLCDVPSFKEWTPAGSSALGVAVTNKKDTPSADWSGYADLLSMRAFTNNTDCVDPSVFPAAYACETFTGTDGSQAAPVNTTGWFLPSCGMLKAAISDSKVKDAFLTIAKYIKIDNEQSEIFPDLGVRGYWTTTEDYNHPTRAYYIKASESGQQNIEKNNTKSVHPVLAF